MSSEPHPLLYRPEIDGLRAIAVLSVLIYHAAPSLLPGGFVGVDVFFVISGYLISRQLLVEWQTTGRLDLAAFWARRMRRLMPALWLVILVTSIVGGMLLSALPDQHSRLLESALYSILYLANFHFQGATGDYFDAPAEQMPLLHLWSLAVEEQYYLVFPVLLLGVMRWRRPPLVTAMAVVILGSFLYAEHLLQVRPEAAFFMMFARLWEFGAGVLVAALPAAVALRMAGWRFALAGLGMVLASLVLIDSGTPFPGAGALLPVLGTASVIGAIHAGRDLGLAGRLLSSKPMAFVGLISYSLYLWHWPILAVDRALRLEPAGMAWGLILLVPAFVLAWASNAWVEVPLRQWRAPPRKVLILYGLGTMAMLGSIRLVENASDGIVARHSEAALAISADRPSSMEGCHFRLSDELGAEGLGACILSAGANPPVVIWGDSHALAWRPLAQRYAAAERVRAVGYSLDSCPPLLGDMPFRPDFPRHNQNCESFNSQVLDAIRKSRPRVLIIASRWAPRIGDDLLSERERQDRMRQGFSVQIGSSEQVSRRLEEMLSQVSPHVGRVLVIGPVPVSRFDVARCIASGSPRQCGMDRREFDRQSSEAREMLRRATSRSSNVQLVEPTPFFCTGDFCPVTKDGYALFWDDDHVSSSAARAFSEAFLADPGPYLAVPAAMAN